MVFMINIFELIIAELISFKDSNYFNKHYYKFFLKAL